MTMGTLTFRPPADLVARADALVPVLEADPETRVHGRVSRSTVLRLALLRGLASLEVEHGQRPPSPAPQRRGGA